MIIYALEPKKKRYLQLISIEATWWINASVVSSIRVYICLWDRESEREIVWNMNKYQQIYADYFRYDLLIFTIRVKIWKFAFVSPSTMQNHIEKSVHRKINNHTKGTKVYDFLRCGSSTINHPNVFHVFIYMSVYDLVEECILSDSSRLSTWFLSTKNVGFVRLQRNNNWNFSGEHYAMVFE